MYEIKYNKHNYLDVKQNFNYTILIIALSNYTILIIALYLRLKILFEYMLQLVDDFVDD